jgi:hypothetical protein
MLNILGPKDIDRWFAFFDFGDSNLSEEDESLCICGARFNALAFDHRSRVCVWVS